MFHTLAMHDRSMYLFWENLIYYARENVYEELKIGAYYSEDLYQDM